MKIVTFNAPAETITDKPMFRDALGRPEITPHNRLSHRSADPSAILLRGFYSHRLRG
jgi:hypothetical protein